ncbi:MAG: hypothetical protein QW424_03080 [Candidatus Bathyarchaeia archaeon]
MTIADILLMIVLAVGIVIGALIVGYLQSTLTSLSGISQEAQSTINQAFSNVFTGLNLATIGIIIFAAMAILGIVLAFFGPREGR